MREQGINARVWEGHSPVHSSSCLPLPLLVFLASRPALRRCPAEIRGVDFSSGHRQRCLSKLAGWPRSGQGWHLLSTLPVQNTGRPPGLQRGEERSQCGQAACPVEIGSQTSKPAQPFPARWSRASRSVPLSLRLSSPAPGQ